MRRWSGVLALVVLVGVVGIVGAEAGAPPAADGPRTFASWNTGLIRGAVALAEQRLPLGIEAVRALDADVVCLNEVWTDEDAQLYIDSLKETYPYSFREATEDTSEETTPCGIWSTWRLSQCATKKCEKKGISVEECVDTGPCGDRYRALDDTCKRCLAANTADPVSCALGGTQEFTAGGRNGLLLLSRLPLQDARYTPFDALLVKRGAIDATVGDVHVTCTHLTADLGLVPYPPERQYKSWAEENAAEVRRLVQVPEGRCEVVMGDLNLGPGGEGLKAELPANWDLIEASALREPMDARFCTWCGENPLARAPHDLQIDHILFQGCEAFGAPTYQRIMDQAVSIEGVEAPTRLSDHFGVHARLAP